MPFADIAVKNAALIRKGLQVEVFVAPYATAALTTIMGVGGDLAPLPVGHTPLGWTTEDGLVWPRETENSEIFGHGSPEPLRSDIRRAIKRLNVTAMETSLVALEQYQGIDLSSVTTALTTNESTWDEPNLPVYPYQRLLAIAQDVSDTGEYYMARYYPRTRITEVGEESWTDSDTPVQRALTYTAYFDEVEGTASRWFLAGPGRNAAAEGFPAPA